MPSRIEAPTATNEAHAPMFAAYEQITGFVPEMARTMTRVPDKHVADDQAPGLA